MKTSEALIVGYSVPQSQHPNKDIISNDLTHSAASRIHTTDECRLNSSKLNKSTELILCTQGGHSPAMIKFPDFPRYFKGT